MESESEAARARRALAEQFRRDRAEAEKRRAEQERHDPCWGWLPRGRAAAWLVVVLVVVVPLVVGGIASLDRWRVADTVNQFCGAVVTRNYAAAYPRLSTRVRSRISQGDLATVLGQSRVASCALNQSAFRFTIADGHARARVAYTVVDAAGLVTGQEAGDMLLVKEGDEWRIDGLAMSAGDPLA